MTSRVIRSAGGALLAVAASAAVYAQTPASGFAEVLAIRSEVLGEDRVAWVRTPASYATSDSRFPVVYLTDAEAQFVHTAVTAEFLARNGRMPEVIVVGITTTDRTRDLTPTRAAMPRPGGPPRELPTAGGADRFLEFLERELIPKIESTYRTVPYRVFAGHSFGGLFAMHAWTARPNLFHAVVAVSPTLVWDDRLIARRVRQTATDPRTARRSLVVTVGNEGPEADRAFAELRTVFEKQDLPRIDATFLCFPDDDHGSVVLPSHVAAFKAIFADWRAPLDPETGFPAGTLADLQAHYRTLTSTLGVEIAPPEREVNLLGYRLLGAGRHDAALEAFRFNAAAHPRSANVHDSLGEAYEKSGDPERARESYARAVALGSENSDPNLEVYRRNWQRAADAARETSPTTGS
jgi:hypothetical protein